MHNAHVVISNNEKFNTKKGERECRERERKKEYGFFFHIESHLNVNNDGDAGI